MVPSTNITVVFWVFVGSALILWVLLNGLDKVAWKKLELVSVLLAAIGLIPATVEAHRWVQEDQVKQTGNIVDMNAKWIQEYIDNSKANGCVTPVGSKGIPAPPKHEAACKWLDENGAALIANSQLHRNIPSDGLNSIPASDPQLQTEMKALVARYDTNLGELTKYQQQSQEKTRLESFNSLVKDLSTIYGPYILAFALALKVAEVCSDIGREKAIARKAG